MSQVATPVRGSNSRKLGQPLVPQKSLELTEAAVDRRRIRRIADARPVTDDVAERVIMGEVTCAFWCARIAVWAIAAHSWFSFGTYSEAGNDGFLDVCAPGRERGLVTRTGSSRRTDYTSTIAEDRRFVKHPMVRGGWLDTGAVSKVAVSQPNHG